MKLSPQWIRDFVELAVDDRRLAEDLTGVGIAVEGISGSGAETVFEMEIGTNRPDAMNHYGVAREAAAIYDASLKQLSALSPQPRLPGMRLSRSRWKSRNFVLAFLRALSVAPASNLRRRKLRGGCSCLDIDPLATLWMRPTMFCGRWASRHMCSIWICWRAASSSFEKLKMARS